MIGSRAPATPLWGPFLDEATLYCDSSSLRIPKHSIKNSTFFMSFSFPQVTCRAVGIGSYLVRLGQRVVQVENSHIILTGAGALNKVIIYFYLLHFDNTGNSIKNFSF